MLACNQPSSEESTKWNNHGSVGRWGRCVRFPLSLQQLMLAVFVRMIRMKKSATPNSKCEPFHTLKSESPCTVGYEIGLIIGFVAFSEFEVLVWVSVQDSLFEHPNIVFLFHF